MVSQTRLDTEARELGNGLSTEIASHTIHRKCYLINKLKFREESTSTFAGFHVGPLSWLNLNLQLEKLIFSGGGKTVVAGEKTKAKREPATNSTHI